MNSRLSRKKIHSFVHHSVVLPEYHHLGLLLLVNHVINLKFGGWCFWFQKPVEDISCVSWNKQVQHILASASPGGKASVWDLRKNDLIIKVSDHSNRVCYFSFLWMPYVEIYTSLLSNLILHGLSACLLLDALLWTGVEPRSGDSASLGVRGRQNACHSDVGLAFCYLASQDF